MKPGNKKETKQDYETPPELIRAICNWLDVAQFSYDLACTKENKKGAYGITESNPPWDHDWTGQYLIYGHGWCWCNPPFNNITPFAKVCDRIAQEGWRVAMLVPLSRTKWVSDYCDKYQIMELKQRVKFVGAKDLYPKDLMLVLFDRTRMVRSRGVLDWKCYL